MVGTRSVEVENDQVGPVRGRKYPPVLTRKKDGNKKQFQHQEKLIENIVEVDIAILKKDTATALQRLEERITLVRNRLKLIKIADRSQFGWRTAKEYQQDDLASSSEDEKRLFRSERRAEQRIKKQSQIPNSMFNSEQYFRRERCSPRNPGWFTKFLHQR